MTTPASLRGAQVSAGRPTLPSAPWGATRPSSVRESSRVVMVGRDRRVRFISELTVAFGCATRAS